MRYPLIRRICLAAGMVVLLTPLPGQLAAQRVALAPTNVTVVGAGELDPAQSNLRRPAPESVHVDGA